MGNDHPKAGGDADPKKPGDTGRAAVSSEKQRHPGQASRKRARFEDEEHASIGDVPPLLPPLQHPDGYLQVSMTRPRRTARARRGPPTIEASVVLPFSAVGLSGDEKTAMGTGLATLNGSAKLEGALKFLEDFDQTLDRTLQEHASAKRARRTAPATAETSSAVAPDQ